MGVIADYIASALSDSVIPHLREPVERVFDRVVEHKGLPTRQDFRELRNRIDMLEYSSRELTRELHGARTRLKERRESGASE
jgi:hypothetical protein